MVGPFSTPSPRIAVAEGSFDYVVSYVRVQFDLSMVSSNFLSSSLVDLVFFKRLGYSLSLFWYSVQVLPNGGVTEFRYLSSVAFGFSSFQGNSASAAHLAVRVATALQKDHLFISRLSSLVQAPKPIVFK